MIEPNHLRLHVIRPTLERIHMWSPVAEELLMGTAAKESLMGRYLVQVGRGPALGIYQMEPRTHDDIWDHWLLNRPEIANRVRMLLSPCDTTSGQLIWNLGYATAMARIHYRRVAAPLPQSTEVRGLGAYWKQHYNTELGAGTVDGFIRAYDRWILGQK